MESRRAKGCWWAVACALLWIIGEATGAAPDDGYFEVAQRDGAWWFVDPAGKPFLSLGVNVISPGPDQQRYNESRSEYAAWRYYPSHDAWAEATTRRLVDWRFNTVGGWSHNLMRQGDMPYAEVLHLGVEEGAPWNDMFSHEFARRMDRLAERRVAPHREDRRLIGWFTDNELAWYADLLFTFHSSQSSTSKTRQRLMQLLHEHYGDDFAALRRDFTPSAGIGSFEQLERRGSLKLRASGRSQIVVSKFAELLASRYYSVVCGAIRRHDPNHLILGDRYHGYCPDAVMRGSARHVDVVSTNYDWPRGVDGYMPKSYLRRLHALTGKPVIVTEYYATATDNRSGNPNTGELFVVVADQPQRAEVVRRRLEMFADEPYVVGAHWFAYADEPPHGRQQDGEDYNFGLVDIHDQPYGEITAVMQRLHGQLADRHATAVRAAATESLSAPLLPTDTPLERVDANLLSQAEVTPREDSGLADLIVAWDADAIYLTVAGNHYVSEEAYAEQPVPMDEGLLWTVTLSSEGSEATFATLALQMLGTKAERLQGDCQFAAWQRGVRYGATLAAPAVAAGRAAWTEGDRIRISGELRDRRDARCTTWDAELTLAPGVPGEPDASAATKVGNDRRD